MSTVNTKDLPKLLERTDWEEWQLACFLSSLDYEGIESIIPEIGTKDTYQLMIEKSGSVESFIDRLRLRAIVNQSRVLKSYEIPVGGKLSLKKILSICTDNGIFPEKSLVRDLQEIMTYPVFSPGALVRKYYKRWLVMDEWTIAEAACLINDINCFEEGDHRILSKHPSHIKILENVALEPSGTYSDLVHNHYVVIQMARSSIACGDLESIGTNRNSSIEEVLVEPVQFLKWALSKNFHLSWVFRILWNEERGDELRLDENNQDVVSNDPDRKLKPLQYSLPVKVDFEIGDKSKTKIDNREDALEHVIESVFKKYQERDRKPINKKSFVKNVFDNLPDNVRPLEESTLERNITAFFAKRHSTYSEEIKKRF